MRNIGAKDAGGAFNWSDKHGPFSFALTQTPKLYICFILAEAKKRETLQEVRKLWKLGICLKFRIKNKHLKPILRSTLNWKEKGLVRTFEDRKRQFSRPWTWTHLTAEDVVLGPQNISLSSLKSHKLYQDETQILNSLLLQLPCVVSPKYGLAWGGFLLALLNF
jgi:hypothetical protein